MKYYYDLYLKCNVLLLADVFKKFRSNSLKNYGLFPCHYLSALTLNWDAMLNMTKAVVEFITNLYMYIFFEKGTRNRVSYISNRFSKANQKYLKCYDPKQESRQIICLDANNLYGYAMSKFLQTSGFKWIDPKEFDLKKDVFLKLIFNILKSYENYTMIIL